MKKFSLLLMIVLIVGAIFISCSAEPSADATKVANVAIDFPKALHVNSQQTTPLPEVGNLYWFYTAVKTDEGFTTGKTNGLTPIRGGGLPGLPGVIGYNGTANSGTFFSTGTWQFTFYGFNENDPSGSCVYSGSDEVTVSAPQNEGLIGGTAEITLSIVNDPRTSGTVVIKDITVDFDNSFVPQAPYKLSVYVNGRTNPIVSTTSYTANDKVVTFYSSSNEVPAAGFQVLSSGGTFTPGFYTLTFKVTKGTEETVYAKGEISIHARLGYEVTIDGDLNSLDSVAYVKIVNNTQGLPQATNENVYTISTEEQLRAFASYVNQGNSCEGLTIKLTDDITLHGDWIPIGNSYRGQVGDKVPYFAGTFDGRKPNDSGNYTISDLRLASNAEVAKDSSGEYVFGLFGVVKNATIKNLNMTNVQIDKVTAEGYSGENVAAVVGYSEGSLTLDNITVGAANDGSYINGAHVAGVISRAYGKSTGIEIKISNCTNYAAISATGNVDGKPKAAGIAAYVSGQGASVKIEDCKNYGAISSTEATANAIAAGIVVHGFNDSYDENYTVNRNTNEGAITLSGGSPLYAKISAECYQNPVENVDSISATGNSNSSTGTVTVNGSNVTETTPLVRNSQGGDEVNVNN